MAARVVKKPVSIGRALAEFLERSGLGRLTVMSGLATKWETLLGSGIAGHSRPDSIRGGVLTVIVESSAWMNQLSLLSPDIIAKLNEGLGDEGQITELRFRMGKFGPARKDESAAKQAPRIKRRKPSADELAEIERAVAKIADPGIRAAARKLLVASCTRKR